MCSCLMCKKSSAFYVDGSRPVRQVRHVCEGREMKDAGC